MIIYKRTTGVSTTDIVGRLLSLTKEHHINQQNVQKMSKTDSNQKISSQEIQKNVETKNRYACYTTSQINNFAKGNKKYREG